MTRLRLLELPSLALQAVLEFLVPFELFDLSQCSRKSAALVRSAGTKQYKLSLESDQVVVNEKYKFEARLSGHQSERSLLGKSSLLLTNGKKISVHVGYYHLNRRRFFFIDSDSGLQVILFHLVALFGCRIDSIDTGFNFPGEIQRSIMGRVIEKQKEIRRLVINNNLNENDLRWIMDNLTITDYCECDVLTSPNFGYEFKTYPRNLSIYGSHWFKLDDLIAAAKSCVVICLLESKLKNKDIDVFMKSWASGDFPTLRYLIVESNNLNERDQILGRNPAQWRDENRRVVQEKIDGKSYSLNSGVRFRKDDGIEAVVEMNYALLDYYFALLVL